MQSKTVIVPLAPGFEELEAITVTDLLTRAGIHVITAGLQTGLVQAARGTRIQPDRTLDDVLPLAQQGDIDLVVLPGGLPGADHLRADPRVIELVQTVHQQPQGLVAAICAAPRVLADAGLLQGKTATAFPGSMQVVNCDEIDLVETPLEDNGSVITSRGPGTAMNFALHLIERLMGTATRTNVENSLVR